MCARMIRCGQDMITTLKEEGKLHMLNMLMRTQCNKNVMLHKYATHSFIACSNQPLNLFDKHITHTKLINITMTSNFKEEGLELTYV